jgi:hypothetical protein
MKINFFIGHSNFRKKPVTGFLNILHFKSTLVRMLLQCRKKWLIQVQRFEKCVKRCRHKWAKTGKASMSELSCSADAGVSISFAVCVSTMLNNNHVTASRFVNQKCAKLQSCHRFATGRMTELQLQTENIFHEHQVLSTIPFVIPSKPAGRSEES